MSYIPEKCRVCGREITTPSRFCLGINSGYSPYCSIKCSLMAGSWISFIGAILSTIATAVILIYVFTQYDVFFFSVDK